MNRQSPASFIQSDQVSPAANKPNQNRESKLLAENQRKHQQDCSYRDPSDFPQGGSRAISGVALKHLAVTRHAQRRRTFGGFQLYLSRDTALSNTWSSQIGISDCVD
jgi:hypothetical protein